MAENNPHRSHNSQRTERTIEQGQDGFIDGQSRGNPTVGTHTPGNHPRSETAREAGQRDVPQSHENREHPEKDHVPGHMGYTRNNVVGVNPSSNDATDEAKDV